MATTSRPDAPGVPSGEPGAPVPAPEPGASPTYQELLDEAVDETFPASDPISPGAAAHAERRVSTAKDETDWALKPGHEVDPPAPDPKHERVDVDENAERARQAVDEQQQDGTPDGTA